MEIAKESTLLPPGNPTKRTQATIVLHIDSSQLLAKLKGPPDFAADRETMQEHLKELLARLKPKLLNRKNVMLNLNLSRLAYPLHLWEETLFVTTQETNFPLKVYITEQGLEDRTHYMENNRTLQKFVYHIDQSRKMEDHTAEDDCETLLKRTIMVLMNQYSFDEQAMELALAETHNLEDLIHYCDNHMKNT